MLQAGLTNSAMDTMLSLRRHYQQTRLEKKEQQSLFSLLKMTTMLDASLTKLQTTDQRDRVFSLLGLAADKDVLHVQVDYGSQTTPKDVLTNTTKQILTTTKELGILSHQSLTRPTKGLPSWVCDWSANLYNPFGDSTHIDKPFHASGNSTANLCFPNYPQEKVLRIEGFRVGEIMETGFTPTVKFVQRDDGSAVKWLVVEEFVSRAEQVFNHLHGLSEEDIARTLMEATKSSALVKVELQRGIGALYQAVFKTT
jgi:hypothetical protein